MIHHALSRLALLATLAAAPAASAEEALLQASEGYVSGWRATHMIDTPVRGVEGEVVGEVWDLLIGPGGALQGVIVQAGGFLGLGETSFAATWRQVEIGPNLAYVTVPVTAARINDFSLFGDNFAGADISRNRTWRTTELIGDYVVLEDGQNYGLVSDLVFDEEGRLASLIVTPDAAGDFEGPYSVPFDAASFDPGLNFYEAPYSREELAEVGVFEQAAPSGADREKGRAAGSGGR
jgi:sporulation protein YlmC with PRC-barrel domain